jgi:hypothetical protein
VSTATDPNNCGGCGQACSTNHAEESCNTSTCTVTACFTG